MSNISIFRSEHILFPNVHFFHIIDMMNVLQDERKF